MKHTRKNIFFHELIGLKARILSSLDPSLVGVSGTILYETSRTLILRIDMPDHIKKREIRVLKSGTVFEFILPSGERVVVEGDIIIGDPAERARRIRRGYVWR